MAFKNYSFCLILLLSLFHFQPLNAIKGGYFTPGNGRDSADIDSTLFTHLFCAFADFDGQSNRLILPSGCSDFPRIVKQKSPEVQALLSIGGGDDKATAAFIAMAKDSSSRKTFIDSSIDLAVQNGFNGLDLDWEQQQTQEEMDNMAALLKEWRAAINAQSATEPLLLTAALRFTAKAGGTNVPFPAQAISDNLDWVNAMAYDFYAPTWAQPPYTTRPHASLRDPSRDESGSSGISAWINAGVPANKLVLGLPFYGYAWTLSNPNDNGLLAPATGGDTSLGSDTLTYKRIKQFISDGATVKYDSTYVTNYCYSGSTWIGYDDTESIKQKVLYAKNGANILGYFAWNIAQDTDDWILSKQAFQAWGQ